MTSPNRPVSPAVEDYMKAIYELSAAQPTVTTTALASAMGVAAASATNMIKRLARLKLVQYSPYRGVTLTRAGASMALEIVRHHRLLELFLNKALGVPWDEVHSEAHRLEHAMSESLEDRIAAYLGNPTEDPHGDPIPSKTGLVAPELPQALADLEPGARATVRRVTDQESAHLRYLQGLGLTPKATVRVVDAAPFEGPLRVRVGSREHSLDRQMARHIRVSPLAKRTR